MSDIAVMQIKIDNLDSCSKKATERLDEHDNLLDSHSSRIQSLEQWRQGNGARGSEERLQCVELYTAELNKANLRPRLNLAESDIKALQRIADSAIMEGVHTAVNETMDKRDKTAIAKIKAWGPIVAALCALGAAMAAALVK